METTDLSNLFVKCDDFDEEDDDEENIFENNGTDSVRFIKVFRQSISKFCICKVFNPEVLQCNLDPNSENKFDLCWYRQLILLREAIFLKKNRHPTIVDFRGFSLYNYRVKFNTEEEEDEEKLICEEGFESCPAIFLEFLINKSLRNHMDGSKLNLDPVKRQICIVGLTAAVRFLHSRGILHRNLVPETIWLDENFYPKVFDFSTTRLFSIKRDSPKTILKHTFFNYQAPELFEDNFDKYDDSIDVFSLGRLIYLMITGFEPYQHPDDQYNKSYGFGLQIPIKNNQHPFFPENMSNEFKNLLERCWSHNPHDRPTATEMYNLIVDNDENFVISEVKSEKDIQEYRKYIEMIEQFEQEIPIKSNSGLSMMKTFELEIPFIDTTMLSDNTAEQIQTLLNFTSTNFASINEDVVLKLLLKMADNQSILRDNYLSKVINYVNNSSQNGNTLADEFLMKVFGNYCVPEDTIEIESESFSKSNETVNIPPNVKKICKRAFANNTNIIRINIPNSVTVIDDDAFSGCTNLKFVNIPKSIEGENLGKGVFKGCRLKYIQIPSNLKIIKKDTFRDNERLATLILNNGLETIGESAFNGCKLIKYLEIPKTVKLIQKEAFNNCKNLSKIFFHATKKPRTEKKALPSKYKALP